MKIVCDACAAKYSIADEKVAGKVFKIRCKKCSNVIVVRGAAEAAEAGGPAQLEQKETRVFDYSGYDSPQDAVAAADASVADGAVWHIVIDQEQVGPLSPEEVRAHFARGEIDGESFIWREGFGDWERVDSLPEFADLAAGANVDDAAAAMFGGPALDDGVADDPADLFTAQSAQPMAAAAPADAGLFGGGADDGGLFGGAAASEPMMADAAEDKLKGERNENSVLFSLNNLASLASDSKPSPSPSQPSASSNSGAGMAQAGGQEGSGLIDIRAMASMYVGNSGGGGGASPAASIDDLPVFSQPAITSASPVLMPVASPANNNKLLYALVAGIGALVLIAVLLVVLVLRGGDSKDDTTQAANQATPAGDGDTDPTKDGEDGEAAGDGDGDGDGDTAGEPAGGKTGPDPSADEAAKKAAAEKAAKEEAKRLEREEAKRKRAEALANETPSQRRARERKEKKEKEARKKREAEKKKREAEARATKAADKKKDPPPTKSGGCDELDCLVNPGKSCCKKSKKPADKPKDSSLPSRPPSSSLSKGMGKASGSAKSCGKKAGFTGKVAVKVKVSSSGRVSSARASGGKGSVNSCVARAVKSRARFPKSQNGISFTYKYRL